MTDAELEVLLEKAARLGASQALEKIGLHDEDAIHDVKELRNLLDTWKATKQTVGMTIAKIITTAILTTLAAGLWFQFGGPK